MTIGAGGGPRKPRTYVYIHVYICIYIYMQVYIYIYIIFAERAREHAILRFQGLLSLLSMWAEKQPRAFSLCEGASLMLRVQPNRISGFFRNANPVPKGQGTARNTDASA